ncbi:FHA domain-containing protein [Aneurinibacillus soli]|uniref:FHA domain protein n=1 Tax=Aneurinibacillus soli TaxID=1500254 RepID=A0A0U5B695_9BACL|nr:FHA domain-containing protein [Aneurinibacillus soli]PYE62628.1 FHA domain-containing protein [Aneurinibacillus soli]BAU27190.1 FHA domain protein [Aneurinibacillus soli]
MKQKASFWLRTGTTDVGTERARQIKIVDRMILIVILAALIYIYFINEHTGIKIVATLFLLALLAVYAVRKYEYIEDQEEISSKITKLVLLDEEGGHVHEWPIQGMTSLLIGKSSKQNEVDIDLSETEYASLISKQHAVLNYSAGCWYIEDIDSKNGTGIQKAHTDQKSKLQDHSPHPIGAGDTIYIANTRIMLT